MEINDLIHSPSHEGKVKLSLSWCKWKKIVSLISDYYEFELTLLPSFPSSSFLAKDFLEATNHCLNQTLIIYRRLFRTRSHHETIISRLARQRLMEQSGLWPMLYAIGKQLPAFHRIRICIYIMRRIGWLTRPPLPIYPPPWNLLYGLLAGV